MKVNLNKIVIVEGLLWILAGGNSFSHAAETVIANVTTTVKPYKVKAGFSTTFPLFSYNDDFVKHPRMLNQLTNLKPQTVRFFLAGVGTPQIDDKTWDFSCMDQMVQPVLNAGLDVTLRLGYPPAFMSDKKGEVLDKTYKQFADYCANVVRYYNGGGFTDLSGKFHVSPSRKHIRRIGIWNEPDCASDVPTLIAATLSPAEYTAMYNTVVPAINAVDPALEYDAVEVCCQDQIQYVKTFLAGVTAPFSSIALHQYAINSLSSTDEVAFGQVLYYADQVRDISSVIAGYPSDSPQRHASIKITEQGVSNNGEAPRLIDLRGANAFYAAYKAYYFSQMSQSGNVSDIDYWAFSGDLQSGQVDYETGGYHLSYWVDYWLARYMTKGSDILEIDMANIPTGIELMAVRNPTNGSVTIMVCNHAVKSEEDINGAGAPRSVRLNLSALGGFRSAALLTIDKNTNLATGPTPASETPASSMEVTLEGYGVSFLKLMR